MIQEYPDYFAKFKCIGGTCPDSCCIGWEVDIDEESYYYYQTLEGPFGDLIRSRIARTSEGDYYFPMVEHKRCPFLNKDNLCDMILALGDEATCTTCNEYPRYFNRIGDYEQVDVSLSCMEVGRLMFETDEPIRYLKSEVGREDTADMADFSSGVEWQEPFSMENPQEESYAETDPAQSNFLEGFSSENDFDDEDMDLTFFDPEFAAADVDEELRDRLIAERQNMIDALQDRSQSINQRIRQVFLTGVNSQAASGFGSPTGFASCAESNSESTSAESVPGSVLFPYPVLLLTYRELEAIDRNWRSLYKELTALTSASDFPKLEQACLAANRERLEIWFEKLAVYFAYRYHLDNYFDEDPAGSNRLAVRSLQFLWLMAVNAWTKKGGAPLAACDIIDLAHIYSRQVEHCEENVEILKEA